MTTIECRGMNKQTRMHSYRVTISGGYDANGKQQRIRRSFKYPDTMSQNTRQRVVKKMLLNSSLILNPAKLLLVKI